ncbi:MAG TPA: YqgE/AlgH family protein [Chitinophagaceae bacterium]|nr:YqgE/AlgH family protein [Chitinophagaceae bacterium]
MNLQAGTFIKSTSALNETYFEQVTIFISEHNEKGAMGFVVSRPFSRTLNELEEFKNSISFQLYEGGPVDQEHIFFLHMRPDLIEQGARINNGIYLGGDFNQVLEGLDNGILGPDHIKLFIGYCGWDKDELEDEIREGSWEIIAGNNADIFRSYTN